MVNALIPFAGPGMHHVVESQFSVMPLMAGTFGMLAVLALFGCLLWRSNRLPLIRRAPRAMLAEDSAKQILAERFARGDISSDEFMERSSLLNWTPGVEPRSVKPRKRR